jgi:hypothetical protein
MKIFISVNQGFAVRYFLKSGILAELIRKNSGIVVFSKYSDQQEFKDEFAGPGVEFATFTDDLSSTTRSNPIYRFLEYFRVYGQETSLSTIKKLERERKNLRNLRGFKKAAFRFLDHVLQIFRGSPKLRHLIQSLDRQLVPPPRWALDLLKKHNPQLVVTSSFGFIHPDAHLIRAATHLKIKTAVAVLSWDNPTTKGLATEIPDTVCAWTDMMRDELVTIQRIAPEKVRVTGVAHFDVHCEIKKIWSAESAKARLDNTRRHSVFLGLGSPTYQHQINLQTIRDITELINQDKLPVHQITVRLHPNYLTDKRTAKRRELLEILESMRLTYPDLIRLSLPNTAQQSANWYGGGDDTKKLAQQILESDLVIQFFSTLVLEASLLGRPVLNISYDALGTENETPNSAATNYPHIKRLMSYGGVKEVKDRSELGSAILSLLEEKSNENEALKIGRDRIVQYECGPNLGGAAKQTARILYDTAAGVDAEIT